QGERDRLGTLHSALRGQAAWWPSLGGKRRSGTREHVRPGIADRKMSQTPVVRILVVEDEQHLADGLRFNLEAEGYQVQVVETGEAALERLAPDMPPFDVWVLECMLSGKD